MNWQIRIFYERLEAANEIIREQNVAIAQRQAALRVASEAIAQQQAALQVAREAIEWFNAGAFEVDGVPVSAWIADALDAGIPAWIANALDAGIRQ